MIHQLIFSGHVSHNESTVVEPQTTDIIYKACKDLGVTGLKFYIDGGYLVIAEGSQESLQIIKNGYHSHTRLSNLTVLLQTKLEQAEFTGFKIFFHKSDARTDLTHCYILNEETLEMALPSSVSKTTKILARTFARVNNFAAV